MLSAASRTKPQRCKGLPRRSQRTPPVAPGVLHRPCAACGGEARVPLRAQERPSCLLQRLLRQDARERLIADSVDYKAPSTSVDSRFTSSRVSALPHIVIGRAQGAAGGA